MTWFSKQEIVYYAFEMFLLQILLITKSHLKQLNFFLRMIPSQILYEVKCVGASQIWSVINHKPNLPCTFP